ncbi:hypothetical protein V3C99_000310, partial [Haemonchus contortus]|uniref:EH domain-containing protein n=1 Tax=Haemonchus contortus TaxID=6289 RepID=A0A7I5E9V6_HAECO
EQDGIRMNNNTPSVACNQQSKIMEEVMMSGNIPIAAPGRAGMMGGGGGVVPPVLLDEARVPRFYRDAIAACGATQQNMLPHTALVYNLMVTSGLPRPVLSYIWSAVNRTLPGQLTRPEFFSCLALIALAQKGESLAALSTMSSLPIPFLQSVQVPVAPSLAAPVVNVAKPTAPPPKEQRQTSSFIPTSLLMGKRSNSKKKDMDLIGEALPPTIKSTGKDEAGSVLPPIPGPAKSSYQAQIAPNTTRNALDSKSNSAMNDLCGIDWPSLTSTQVATASRDLSSPTTESSKSDEDVSTASNISMACSTASEINGSAQMSHAISAELLECWEKVIAAATEIFKTADRLLGSANDSVIREVAQTERGDGYLRCLNHLHFVVCRVERSAKSELPKGCREEIDYCTRIWKRLVAFIENPEEEDRDGAVGKPCAICCQPVSRAVHFGGQTYHSECANLWVNDVNSLLPNMHLVS